jgi:Family of unknown function (DUF6205)
MSNPTHITGRITITPPLPWKQVKDSPYLKANARAQRLWPDALLEVVEATVQTDDGELTRREAVAIIPDEGAETSARTLISDVQAIIDANPEHEFTGRFNCEGEENSDIWRAVIRDRRVARVNAMIVWPEGSE